jgi:hypothetical protein
VLPTHTRRRWAGAYADEGLGTPWGPHAQMLDIRKGEELTDEFLHSKLSFYK